MIRPLGIGLVLIAICLSLFGCSTVKPLANARENTATVSAPTCASSDQLPSPLPPVEQPQSSGIEQVAYIAQPEEIPHPEDSSGPVRVEALVQYAMANNPRIRVARHQAGALAAQVPQAVSLPDPTLVTTVFTEEIQTAAGPQEIALSLSQKLPWFGKRSLRGQVAHQQARAACAQVVTEELKVIEQVKRAYFDLYFIQNAIDETRRLQPRLEDIVEIARAKYETHTPGASMENVLQARIELAKLKTMLIRLEQLKVETQARLSGVLHLPPDTPFVAVAKIEHARVMETAKILVDLAESCQPQLEAARHQVARDCYSIALARKDYWPDVTVGFNWYEIGPQGLSPVADGRDATSLGIGLNMPIYRRRLDAAVRQARHNTSASRYQYAATRDSINTEIQSLYAQFQQQQQILAILDDEILPQSKQTLELALESYRTGRQDFQQLIDIYRRLLEFRIEYHRRAATREQAIASLERAVGCAVTAGPEM
ncbi:MAG: TolC family protein [Pirellulales bacterium]|nr:TolC family protein [Pirellulales bacterium]